ncbi:hypothetical protein [Aquabacterium sp.]|uniref:hypothetical protein n=1 Tax=Aquabacterium TaxID=92793 RepID=UPI001DF55E8D|nr:hypothetical protein [Aquabacterium sp.]MBT9608986.1 hypothetical protein [Aquabacterium sp.]|tara:strand:- start:1474 stop:2397 length:924 start_codon:yes stop_codon:yes gene_type:complete
MKTLPLHTRRYLSIQLSDLKSDEIVIAAESYPEERSQLSAWDAIRQAAPERVVTVSNITPDDIVTRVGSTSLAISLTDEEGLAGIFSSQAVLVDISSLPHHVWAPLFRACITYGKQVRALYVEPEGYKSHPSPASANLFDLSVSFDGLAPLPGFAKLTGPAENESSLLIAFLGFEGNRAERIINQLEPVPKVVPVIGAPGFQINYPAITVACNRSFLSDFDCNSEIRFARASCPFEAYEILASVRRNYPDHYLYIAPVGTRPHALGAVWYALHHSDHCEILFDHPVRQSNRTSGRGLTHIYDFYAVT